ncbi:hypothetical protein ABZ863_32985 [Saccharomonospora sp. NPDC046836]|uniref:hypothetical protein n=1 Tax=Saccharomonospora sp. NPDC046836 TaxID=3156921 RepID=UPI0033CCD711
MWLFIALPDLLECLAGVRPGLYEAADGETPTFTCVSDADGDCSFVVTGTAVGGFNEGPGFWVRRVAAPEAWFGNDAFRMGGTVTTPYRVPDAPAHGGHHVQLDRDGAGRVHGQVGREQPDRFRREPVTSPRITPAAPPRRSTPTRPASPPRRSPARPTRPSRSSPSAPAGRTRSRRTAGPAATS